MKAIMTIGYEGTEIDAFIRTLKASGAQILADVREVPISRKKGFSKSKLADRLASEGIRYVHLKGLGDPKPGREAAKAGRLSEFRSIFRTHLRSAIAQSDLEIAEGLLKDGAVCLMCYEAEPQQCHRTMVAAELSRRTGAPISPISPSTLGSQRLAA